MFSDLGLNCKQTEGGIRKGGGEESHLGWESCLKKPRQVFETNRFPYLSSLKAFQHMEPRMKAKTRRANRSSQIPLGCLWGFHDEAHGVVRFQGKAWLWRLWLIAVAVALTLEGGQSSIPELLTSLGSWGCHIGDSVAPALVNQAFESIGVCFAELWNRAGYSKVAQL